MQREKKIQEAYIKGYSVKYIAQLEDISREAVYQHLRKLPNWQTIQKTTKLQRKNQRFAMYKEYLDEIKLLRLEGVPATRIAQHLQMPYPIVVGLLKDSPLDNSHSAKSKRNAKIYKEYRRGKSQTQLAIQFGLAQNTISGIISKWETSHKTSKLA